MFKWVRKIYDWATQKAYSTKAPLWIGVVFLLELILFLPLDALLMLFCWENPKKRFIYAGIATLASTLVGLAGYLFGHLLWDAIGPFVIAHLISPAFFERLVSHYQSHQNLAVMVGSFLPIPFKAVSLSAGFCHLALMPYLIFVCLARAARFFLIAQMMFLWGDKIKAFVDRHFNRILVAIGAKIALTFTFFWALAQ